MSKSLARKALSCSLLIGLGMLAACSYRIEVHGYDESGRPLYEEEWRFGPDGAPIPPLPRPTPSPGEKQRGAGDIPSLLVGSDGLLIFERRMPAVSSKETESARLAAPISAETLDYIVVDAVNSADAVSRIQVDSQEDVADDSLRLSFAIRASAARVLNPFSFPELAIRTQLVGPPDARVVTYAVEGPSGRVIEWASHMGFTHIEWRGLKVGLDAARIVADNAALRCAIRDGQ